MIRFVLKMHLIIQILQIEIWINPYNTDVNYSRLSVYLVASL